MHACNIWIILKNLHCLSEIQICVLPVFYPSNLVIHTLPLGPSLLPLHIHSPSLL